jgi:hypothetical protein
VTIDHVMQNMRAQPGGPTQELRWLVNAIEGDRRWERKVEGTPESVTEFVGYLQDCVRAENKPRSAERCMAFALMQRRLLPRLTQTAFHHIKAVKFAFQLSVRIRLPKMIDQAQSEICGVNALCVRLAKEQPIWFARLAIDLFQLGRGRYGGVEVEAGSTLCNVFAPPDRLTECDYVVLSPLRRSFGPTWFPGIDPTHLCNYLRSARYTQVENNTTWKCRTDRWIDSKSRFELGRMAEKLAAGHGVIMMVCGTLFEDLHHGRIPTRQVSRKMPEHWIYVTRLTWSRRGRDGPEMVDIKYYTWGYSRRASVDTEIFLSHFYGFISYKERL